jgi:hypothetical protein
MDAAERTGAYAAGGRCLPAGEEVVIAVNDEWFDG